ncbi:MAG TPA: hypothetical protein VGQ80_14840, partial [Acidimicrobiia bacterium]|nr:hypothetical protein [Acidimicrobiia bacterium]
RLLGVTVSNLTAAAVQQESLFGGDGQPSSAPAGQIQSAVDAIRARFGADALGSAALVEPGAGVRVRRQGTPYGPAEQPP